MKMLRIVPIYALLFVFIIFSCSNNEDDNSTGAQDGHPPPEMIGTWIYQSVSVDSVPASLSMVMDWVPNAVEARLHIVNDIGSFVYEEVNIMGGQLWVETGFVYVDGNEIDVNILYDGDANPVNETIFMTFTLLADTLTLQEIDDGTVRFFTLFRD